VLVLLLVVRHMATEKLQELPMDTNQLMLLGAHGGCMVAA
jgi:hypothetical protein